MWYIMKVFFFGNGKKQTIVSFFAAVMITFSFYGSSAAQTAHQHESDKELYQFLDELAGIHVVDIATAVKAFSSHDFAEYFGANQWSKPSRSQHSRNEQYTKEYMQESGCLKQGVWQLYAHNSLAYTQLLTPKIACKDNFVRALIRSTYGYRKFSAPYLHEYQHSGVGFL